MRALQLRNQRKIPARDQWKTPPRTENDSHPEPRRSEQIQATDGPINWKEDSQVY